MRKVWDAAVSSVAAAGLSRSDAGSEVEGMSDREGTEGGSPVKSPILEATHQALEVAAMLKGRSPWMSESESSEEQRRLATSYAGHQRSGGGSPPSDLAPSEREDEGDSLLLPRAPSALCPRGGRGGGIMDSLSDDDDATTVEDIEPHIPPIDIEIPRLSSFTQSSANCINLLMGIGLLSYPYVLKLAGWVPGISCIILMALICRYTGNLIAELMEYPPPFKLREGPGAYTIVGFHDLGRVAFGTAGSLFVSAAFIGETFGYGCIYLIVEGDNLHKLLGDHESFKHLTRHDFILISLIIFLPTLWLRNLSLLSYFSALGAMSACTLWLGVIVSGVDGAAPNDAYCKGECTGSILDPAPTEIARWSNITAVIGLCMVGFSGHAVFPTLRLDMQDTRLYPRVLDLSYTFLLVLYLTIASAGYLMFGDDCQEEITLNLGHSLVSQLAVWVVVVNPITKFALDMAPVCLGVEGIFFESFRMKREGALANLVSIVLRTSVALCAVLVVFAVPSFSVMMGIMGSICSFTIAVTFPCACFLRLKWRQLSVMRKVVNIVLIVLGLFASVSGAIASASG